MQENINDFLIEVAYANSTTQIIMCLKVSADISLYEAIKLSNIMLAFPKEDIINNFDNFKYGIFGKKINPQTYKLKPNDRIEIYNALNATPNQKRLERIKQNAKK